MALTQWKRGCPAKGQHAKKKKENISGSTTSDTTSAERLYPKPWPLCAKGALGDSSNADPGLDDAVKALVSLKDSAPTAQYEGDFLSSNGWSPEPPGDISIGCEDEEAGSEDEDEVDELEGDWSSDTGNEGMKIHFLSHLCTHFIDCCRPRAAL
jgi:hypothetical protein